MIAVPPSGEQMKKTRNERLHRREIGSAFALNKTTDVLPRRGYFDGGINCVKVTMFLSERYAYIVRREINWFLNGVVYVTVSGLS